MNALLAIDTALLTPPPYDVPPTKDAARLTPSPPYMVGAMEGALLTALPGRERIHSSIVISRPGFPLRLSCLPLRFTCGGWCGVGGGEGGRVRGVTGEAMELLAAALHL